MSILFYHVSCELDHVWFEKIFHRIPSISRAKSLCYQVRDMLSHIFAYRTPGIRRLDRWQLWLVRFG